MQIVEFLKAEGKRLSANTQKSYHNDLDLLARDISGDEPVIAEIIAHLNKIDNMSTLTRHKAAIFAYWLWRYPETDENGILLKPLIFPRHIFAGKKQEVWRPVDPKVMQDIIDHVTDPDDKFLLDSYNILGCRARELLGIKREDILLTGIRMRVKGGKIRTVPANAAYLARLLIYARGKDGLIFKQSYDHIYNVVKKVSVSLGYKDIRLHDYRHSYSINMKKKGVEDNLLRQFRGDKNTNTLSRYTVLTERDLQEEIEKANR